MRKRKKTASEARWETDEAYVAFENLHTQMEQVDQQRATAQEARADDQAVLVGLRDQLEAAHAEALTAMCQQIQANNHVALAEATQNRAEALTVQQDHVERDLRQQLAQTHNLVVDL